ncbi:hypothetical protein M0Q50_06740 [bacterium]|jgi:hypothetical protein|nr:hypothetical protein [bacterium]
MNNDEVFFIVYPRGDKTKLSVASLSYDCLYEKNEYSVASRKEFDDEIEATEYCRKLAKENNLIFEGDSDGNVYLD